MKRTIAFVALALLGACGDDDGTVSDGQPTPDARVDAAPLPTMPALGETQIDRMGRAAINTAANAPFETDTAVKTAAKDAYNQASDPNTWFSAFAGSVTDTLAIIDVLNHSSDAPDPFEGCGDQPGYIGVAQGGIDNNTAYAAIAGLALDDRIYVNTDFAECFFYLGVEAAVLGLLPSEEDCGGRVPHVITPTQDPIDITYQVVAGNPLEAPSNGISDGISEDDKQDEVSNDTFPFLAAP